MRYLILDDDVIDRKQIVRTLSGIENSEYEEASAVSQALELLKQNTFDLILSDYHLPDATGLDLLLAVNEMELDTAVVILSGEAHQNIANECIKAGAQDFILKDELSVTRIERAIAFATIRHDLETVIKEQREEMQKLAQRDALTGLGNRYRLDLDAPKFISLAQRQNKASSLLLIDVDKFKYINDNLGHDVGDAVLNEIARRLECAIRNEDVAFRMGGDEFAILTHDTKSFSGLHTLSKRILDEFKQPIIIQERELNVKVSMGVASYPSDGEDLKSLFKCADIALYRAKESGRNQFKFFNQTMLNDYTKRTLLESELERAIDEGQLILHYQPIILKDTGKLSGFEVLLRWQHPERGLLYPSDFLHIAEEHEKNLIYKIGRWVIKQSFLQTHEWYLAHQDLVADLRFAINLSKVQIHDEALLPTIKECIDVYPNIARNCEFEMRENLSDSNAFLDFVATLKAFNARVSLGGFGTGLSSFLDLESIPFNAVKIDSKCFKDLDGEKGRVFLRALVDFAKQLGLEVIAESIETQPLKEQCDTFNIDRIQGYYCGKPVCAEEFEASWLSQAKHYDVPKEA